MVNRSVSSILIVAGLILSLGACKALANPQNTNLQINSFQDLLQAIANAPDHVAEWTAVANWEAAEIKITKRFTIARKQGKTRREEYPRESNVRLKNKADRNYKIVTIGHPGRPSMAFDPQAKTYTEAPDEFNVSPLDSLLNIAPNWVAAIKAENVGIVNIDGHEAAKIRVTLPPERPADKGADIFFYFARDLKNLLIRIDGGEDKSGSLTVSHVSLDVPDELFELPKDYKKVDFRSFKDGIDRHAKPSRPQPRLRLEPRL